VLASAALPAAAQSTDPKRCSVQEPSFCLNGVSNAVTGLDSLRVALPSGQGQRAGEEERTRDKNALSRRIVVAACEQCGRNRLPEVRAPISVAQLCEASQAWPTKWLLAPGAATRLQAAARSIAGPLALAAGPEAGFSDDETQALITAGFSPLQLGPRTLRTETAATAALAALNAIAGDG